MPYPIMLNRDDNCPPKSSLVVVELKKYGLVVSGDVQTMFPYMSGARSPPVDAHMSAQDAYMPRSLTEFVRCLLKGNDKQGTSI